MAVKKVNPNRVNRAKKPKETKHMTKEEKRNILLCAVAAVIIILVIVFVPDMVKKAKNLKVDSEGAVTGVTDNELVCNISDTSEKAYRKLCTVDTIPDGYQFGEKEDGPIDTAVYLFSYTATDESAPVQEYRIQAGTGSAKDLAEKTPNRMSTFADEILSIQEAQEVTVNGQTAYWYEIKYTDSYTSDEETGESITMYHQMVALCVQSNYADNCVVLAATVNGTSEDAFTDSQTVLDVLEKAAEGVTLADKT